MLTTTEKLTILAVAEAAAIWVITIRRKRPHAIRGGPTSPEHKHTMSAGPANHNASMVHAQAKSRCACEEGLLVSV